MKVIASSVRKGNVLEIDGKLYVVLTAGSFDLLVEAVCRDNESLLAFLTEKLRRIPGVVATETFVYLRIVKQSYHWGTGKP